MKIQLVDENYMLIEQCAIVPKEQSGIVYDPLAGIGSSVLTYRVVDHNKHDKFKGTIIGVHKPNVYPFEVKDTKYYAVDIRNIVFIAELDDTEKTLNELERKEMMRAKPSLEVPDKKLIIT